MLPCRLSCGGVEIDTACDLESFGSEMPLEGLHEIQILRRGLVRWVRYSGLQVIKQIGVYTRVSQMLRIEYCMNDDIPLSHTEVIAFSKRQRALSRRLLNPELASDEISIMIVSFTHSWISESTRVK